MYKYISVYDNYLTFSKNDCSCIPKKVNLGSRALKKKRELFESNSEGISIKNPPSILSGLKKIFKKSTWH